MFAKILQKQFLFEGEYPDPDSALKEVLLNVYLSLIVPHLQ